MNRNPTNFSAFSKVLFEGLTPIKVLLLYRPLSLPFIADHKFSILVQTPGDAIIISDSKEDGCAHTLCDAVGRTPRQTDEVGPCRIAAVRSTEQSAAYTVYWKSL